MSKHTQNVSFTCERCAHQIEKLSNGSYRNHCPVCLWSKHVDVKPGDRANGCKGLMAPVGLHNHKKKGWQIIHHCTACGHVGRNKIAIDTFQPDDQNLIVRLSRQVWRE